MCTLIGYFSLDRMLLAMNRDDHFDRRHSEYFDEGGIWYPVDSRSKGTWIGVNTQTGDVAALLNGRYSEKGKLAYQKRRSSLSVDAPKPSRGEIIPLFLQDSRATMTRAYAERFPHFELLIARNEDEYNPIIYDWDGISLQTKHPLNETVVLTSSSYGFGLSRKCLLQTDLEHVDSISVQDAQLMLSSHSPELGPASPCMHGPRSATLSSTIIEIGPSKTGIETEGIIYEARGFPCKASYVALKRFRL